jgi:uncharacterized protein YceK
MKRMLIILLAVMLSGCSLVQWLPSSSCEHVKYERIGRQVEVEASCSV